MPATAKTEPDALSRGAYSASEGLRLLNFSRTDGPARSVSRNTVSRWLRGYDFGSDGEGHSEPLWRPDYQNDDDLIELSFRDLIELRFVKRKLLFDRPIDQQEYRKLLLSVRGRKQAEPNGHLFLING